MTQVKDMANTRLKLPKTLNGSGHLGSNVVGMAQQDSRVEVALDGTLGAHTCARLAQTHCPIHAKTSAARAAIRSSHKPPPFTKTIVGVSGNCCVRAATTFDKNACENRPNWRLPKDLPSCQKHNGLSTLADLHGAILNDKLGYFFK